LQSIVSTYGTSYIPGGRRFNEFLGAVWIMQRWPRVLQIAMKSEKRNHIRSEWPGIPPEDHAPIFQLTPADAVT
jgi:hypothetical protein